MLCFTKGGKNSAILKLPLRSFTNSMTALFKHISKPVIKLLKPLISIVGKQAV
jgi:hypothetical protein